MFKVNISAILNGIGEKRQVQATLHLKVEDELFRFEKPVQIDLSLTNLGKEVLVNGTAQTTVELRCPRCDAFFSYPVKVEIEEEFPLEEHLFQFNAEDKKIGREDLAFIVDAQGNIELEELVKQSLISELPLAQACAKCQEEVHYKV